MIDDSKWATITPKMAEQIFAVYLANGEKAEYK